MNNNDSLLENIDLNKKEQIIKECSSINKLNPYSSSGFFRKLIVSWAYNIVKLSNYVSLNPKYFGYLPKNFESKYYYKDFRYIWFEKNYKNRKYIYL